MSQSSPHVPSVIDIESDAVVLEEEMQNLFSHLRRAVALPQQLDVTLAKLDVVSRPGGIGGSSKLVNERNPIAFEALFAHEAMRRVLTTQAADVREGMRLADGSRIDPPIDDSTRALAMFLLGHDVIDWMSAQDSWRHAYNSIISVIADAERTIDLPELNEPEVDPNAPELTVANIPEAVMNAYATTSNTVIALKAHGITNVTAGRIRSWASKPEVELTAVNRTVIRKRYQGGWTTQTIETLPTYLFRDVALLWLAAEVKKLEKVARKSSVPAQADMAVAA